MKHGLRYALAIIVTGMIGFGAGSAAAQTTSSGPYYATPSWDQQLPASTRFVVLSNWGGAAVLDRESGLVWERSPSTPPDDWNSALYLCSNLKTGNRMGWKLPTIQELTSLVEPGTTGGLPVGHPFMNVVNNSIFWSATANAADGSSARGFFFISDFSFVVTFAKFQQLSIWCVRSGQGVDAQ